MRLIAFLAALALSGCGLVYKIDVQQGNYVTQDLVAKVKNGMTRAEVKQILGTPLLLDPFHANRWDYYFSNVQGRKPQDRTLLSVFFEADKVVAVSGNAHAVAPGEPAAAAEEPRTAPKAAAPPAAAPKPAAPPATR
jgi:outer membrane protein assembly factor BamE